MAELTKNQPHVHLIGIGGAGMSAIARVLLGLGYSVSGSDRELNEQTAALSTAGARIYRGHQAVQIQGASLVVRSSAIPDDNPEVTAAGLAGIPVLKRAEFLGQLMADRSGIAVAGTHGKTTTTGMIGHILLQNEADPTIIVGGVLPGLEVNGRAGRGTHFVIEADEYDHMFLGLRPSIAVVTNVDFDHPDIFPTPADYARAYQEFVGLVPEGGRLVLCADDPGALVLLDRAPAGRAVTVYGTEPLPRLPGWVDRLEIRSLIINDRGGHDGSVFLNGEPLGVLSLQLPGQHNALNGLAACAAVLAAGVSFSAAAAALAGFAGMGRRFEIRGEIEGITLVDDYAHHPTEIAATLIGARTRFPTGRLWAVWQPHTFSRTKLFLSEFQHCFAAADEVVVLEIYRSRETDSLGISGQVVADKILHPRVTFIPDLSAAAAALLDQLQPGDVVITMNAGDATQLHDQLLEGLREKVGKDGETETIIQARRFS